MKIRFILLAFILALAAFQTVDAGGGFADKGTLQLFVNGKRVPVSLPEDAKLYQLFGDLIASGAVTEVLDESNGKDEIRNAQECSTRLIFTARQQFSQPIRYGGQVECKRIIVAIPETHIPQILVQGTQKIVDLSNYSNKALNALAAYPKINKANLPQNREVQSQEKREDSTQKSKTPQTY